MRLPTTRRRSDARSRWPARRSERGEAMEVQAAEEASDTSDAVMLIAGGQAAPLWHPSLWAVPSWRPAAARLLM